MANINNKDEPSTAPTPDRWYNLNLGSSFKDHHPSSKFCTLRYEFKPASIDKSQTGTLTKNKDNRVTVEFQNNQHGKPKVTFEGSSEEYKDNDAVLFFDGETFRLERLHRAVKRLRHVRTRGESAASVAGANTGGTNAVDTSSPSLGKSNKFQSANKGTTLPVSVEVERIEIGDFKNLDSKPRNERTFGSPTPRPNLQNTSPDMKSPDAKIDDLDEQLDILNNDDEDPAEEANRRNVFEKEFHSGIDINIPQQNDTDDEIAEIDVSDDDVDKGPSAAEVLREQVNAEGRATQTSSSSSSESASSGSGSKSSSESGSGSGSSSSDGDSSDEVTSI